jgi:sterol desaturase/sphingolipid hydroxylase (fatty acid hydroxylase superfamily)
MEQSQNLSRFFMQITLIQSLLLASLIAIFSIMEFIHRKESSFSEPTRNEGFLELGAFVSLVAVMQPLAIFGSYQLGKLLIPKWEGAMQDWSWWLTLLTLFVADDMIQYWWHRLAHTSKLWPLHRPHHTAEYMGIRVTFRNNFFYYLLMPSLWIAGTLLFLGLNPYVSTIYLALKLFVLLGAHSSWRWDECLYKTPGLHPLMWLLERTVSTPATHWAHHALSDSDGVGHYTGNFGNFLFVWDVLFGTARITRRYPLQVGLQEEWMTPRKPWYQQLFF